MHLLLYLTISLINKCLGGGTGMICLLPSSPLDLDLCGTLDWWLWLWLDRGGFYRFSLSGPCLFYSDLIWSAHVLACPVSMYYDPSIGVCWWCRKMKTQMFLCFVTTAWMRVDIVLLFVCWFLWFVHCIVHVLYSAISVTFVLILADSNASYRKCTDSRYNSFTVYQKHRRNIALVAGFAFSRRCWFLSSCWLVLGRDD